MFQALTDKIADYAAPALTGLALWYGTHYAIFTPRILKVDLPKEYAYELRHDDISRDTIRCGQSAIVSETLANARWQAAIHTASFEHVSGYFRSAQREITYQVNRQCGVHAAIARNEALKAQEEARVRREIARQAKFDDGLKTLGTIIATGKALLEEASR